MVRPASLSTSIWAQARWLVLAPHPDDETIGAGALISDAAGRGRLGGVVYLNDGTGSHPEGTKGLASARRSEARRAIRRLAERDVVIDWIGWTDARPPGPETPRFHRDAMRLGVLLRRRRIDALAVTDLTESHCDHVAAYALAKAAIGHARRAITLFAYHVWSAPPASGWRRMRTNGIAPGRRRQALRAHRSQLSPLFGDGFRLPSHKCRMAPHDILTLRS